jgi:TonB family protein
MAGRALVCIWLLVLVWVSTEARALAQVPPIEPPSRLDTGNVPYPTSATGQAAVVLELVVDRDGTVGEVLVVEGGEPFASAARDAAKSWRFEPATRGGDPIRARIRLRVDFVPPAPVRSASSMTSGSPSAAPHAPVATTPPLAQGGAGDRAQEVTVHGTRAEPGRQEMTGGEVRQMPGSFGDAFRAIEALPGVIPLLSGLPYFLVRGAPPGNTGFFVDGVRVPALFHLGVGAAVIHPGLIDHVDFFPGGYPAHFGRFTGGILSGEILRPPVRPHAEASVRLIDMGALVETPVDSGRGTLLASGRYGYPGPLLSLFAPNTSLAYWDYQTRVRWKATDRDEVGAFVFGSYDSISQRDQNTGRMAQLLGIQFHRVDLRWDRRTSTTGALRVALTLGYDRSAAGDTSQPSNFSFIESGTVGLRTEWSERAADNADVRIGTDVVLEPYRVRLPFGGQGGDAASRVTGADQTDVNSGLYAELVWRAAPRIELRPGLRVDVFTSRYPGQRVLGGASGTALARGALDPRLAFRWDATDTLAWVAALGVTHQASNIPFPSPGLQFSQLASGLQSAYQVSAGAEIKLPAEFTATADVFMHDYNGLVDFIENCPPGESTCTFNGDAVGLEVLVRRSLTKRFTGWLSYTLSHAERDSFYQGVPLRRLSEFDRTHVGNLILAADLGQRWRAGARLVAYSGLPYSTSTGSIGPPDARGPPFFRIDVRIEKRWNAFGGTMAFVLEWLNVLLSKEAFGTSCNTVYSQGPNGVTNGFSTSCQPTEVGPVTFPSIGLEASWP